MLICNRLDLQTLGSQPVMPKNLLDHCLPIILQESIEYTSNDFYFYLYFISFSFFETEGQ